MFKTFVENVFYIYVLRLDGNKYYVGKTTNPKSRIRNHVCGNGSNWTKLHKVVETVRVFKQQNETDELSETLKYMNKYGIDNVRGAHYCEINLPLYKINSIKKSLDGINDNCFNCRSSDHISYSCPSPKINTIKQHIDKRTCYKCISFNGCNTHKNFSDAIQNLFSDEIQKSKKTPYINHLMIITQEMVIYLNDLIERIKLNPSNIYLDLELYEFWNQIMKCYNLDKFYSTRFIDDVEYFIKNIKYKFDTNELIMSNHNICKLMDKFFLFVNNMGFNNIEIHLIYLLKSLLFFATKAFNFKHSTYTSIVGMTNWFNKSGNNKCSIVPLNKLVSLLNTNGILNPTWKHPSLSRNTEFLQLKKNNTNSSLIKRQRATPHILSPKTKMTNVSYVAYPSPFEYDNNSPTIIDGVMKSSFFSLDFTPKTDLKILDVTTPSINKNVSNSNEEKTTERVTNLINDVVNSIETDNSKTMECIQSAQVSPQIKTDDISNECGTKFVLLKMFSEKCGFYEKPEYQMLKTLYMNDDKHIDIFIKFCSNKYGYENNEYFNNIKLI